MTTPSADQSAATSSKTATQAQVLYDGMCPLCQRSVRVLRKLDWFGVLRYVDVRDPAQVPPGFPVADKRLLEEMHLLTPDGLHILHGFKAFRWMAWRLPLLWVLAPFLYLPGMETIGQRVYLWIARNRFRLIPCHGGVCSIEK